MERSRYGGIVASTSSEEAARAQEMITECNKQQKSKRRAARLAEEASERGVNVAFPGQIGQAFPHSLGFKGLARPCKAVVEAFGALRKRTETT